MVSSPCAIINDRTQLDFPTERYVVHKAISGSIWSNQINHSTLRMTETHLASCTGYFLESSRSEGFGWLLLSFKILHGVADS